MTRIVLSGADGCGKSTLSRLLASYLSGRGSTAIHWLRGSHLVASVLARFLGRFSAFRGSCNPYYGVCVPRVLRSLWVWIEFWSVVPYVLLRFLLAKLNRFLVCDRGVADFLVWVIVTLGYPGFLRSVLGRFLFRLAMGENVVYLYADRDVLVERADVPRDFIYRELAVYSVLMKYLARCWVDTGRYRPVEAAARVLRCLGVA